MKNILFYLFIILAFIGCGKSIQNSYIATSNPIFITEKIKGLSFNLSSQGFSPNFEQNLTKALEENGYKKAIQNPDIIIKTNLNYLRKNSDIRPNNFMEIGIGFGGFRGIGFGSRFGGGFDSRYENEHFYDAQAELFIAISKGKEYQTNLNLQSQKSSYDYGKAQTQSNFEAEIINKIIDILNGF